jgi:pyridoxamine 5'-phosphate oxidase
MNVGNAMTTDLNEVLANAWALLEQGVASRRHGFHFAAVATVGVSGVPRIRTVILRAADSAVQRLRFHTDIRSQKCKDLAANPNIALVFYDEASKTQVRVEGRASLHSDDALADASWAASQPMSRLTYGTMPVPGLAIGEPDSFSLPAPQSDVEWARPHFAAVLVQVQTLQWLYLKEGGQRCAVFDFVADTRSWTVPS